MLVRGDVVQYSNQYIPPAGIRQLKTNINIQKNLRDYGAVGDGIVDDTAAVNAWIASECVRYGCLYVPSGKYKITSQIVLPIVNDVSFIGDGQSSVFIYSGATTNHDVFTVGDPTLTTLISNWYLANFKIVSTTIMTNGAGLSLNYIDHSWVDKVNTGGFDLATDPWNRTLWNGIRVNAYHILVLDGVSCYCLNDGIPINGHPTNPGYGTNVWILGTYSDVNGAIGLHIGGGVGGLFADNLELLGNVTANVKIDRTLANADNREIMFSDTCVFDGVLQTAKCIHVNDAVSSNCTLTIGGLLGSAVGAGLHIQNFLGVVTINCNRLFNNGGDGVLIDDANTYVYIAETVDIALNGGYGINASVLTNNISYNGTGKNWRSNISGNWNANTEIANVLIFPSVTTTGAPFTNTSQNAYLTEFKGGYYCDIDIIITTVGAASGFMLVAIPSIEALHDCVGSAVIKSSTNPANILTNLSCLAFAGTGGGTNIAVCGDGGTLPFVDGDEIIVSIFLPT